MTKQTIKVFVAEDEPQVAEAIGFDIKKIVATYPSAALELCVVTGHTEASKTQMLAFRPHLAIFDHNLSPGNGFELARALRDVDSSAYIVLRKR